jgi:6-phosphogluconolactonase
MPSEVIVDGVEALAERLAERIAREAEQAIDARGRFALALPGGSVARACFPRLARVPFDWPHTTLLWGDERAVPPADPESNYGLARELWLAPARVPERSVHRMRADSPDLERAAAEYADGMVRLLGDPPRLDVALLGAGPDGHVCSLFPGHPLLRDETHWAAAVEDAPKPPARRITLTLRTLAHADLVAVVAFGTSKASAVHAALHDPQASTPLALVARRAGRLLFLLDPDAARTP